MQRSAIFTRLCLQAQKTYLQHTVGSIDSLIIGALSFRKEHDVRTLAPALDQVKRLTNRKITTLSSNRDYRGLKQYDQTQIVIPGVPKAKENRYERSKKSYESSLVLY